MQRLLTLTSRAMLMLFTTCAILALGASQSLAQRDSARVIADRYTEANKELDWETCAAMTHPKDLGRLKGLITVIFERVAAADSTPPSFLAFFDGAKSLDDVISLDSTKFYVGFMSWVTNLVPSLSTAMSGSETQILGVVDETPNKKLFVYRISFPMFGENVTESDVLVLEFYNGQWMIMMEEGVDKLVNIFRKM